MSLEEIAEKLERTLITRRDFLRRAFIEVPLVALAATTSLRGNIILRERKPPEPSEFQDAVVSKYNIRILAAAYRLLGKEYRFVEPYHLEATIFAGAAIGTELAIRRDKALPPREIKKDEPLYRRLLERLTDVFQDVFFARKPLSRSRRLLFASAGAAVLNRVIDNYSTVRFSQVMQDPRFAKYGFDQYFYEGNPGLSYHPKPEEILSRRNRLIDAVAIVTSYFSPVAGFSLGLTTPLIYLNNAGGAKWVEHG